MSTPSAPTNLSFVDTPFGLIQLFWTPPINDDSIIGYTIQYSVSGEDDFYTYSDELTEDTSIIIRRLPTASEYDFKIAAVNQDGIGTYATVSNVSVSLTAIDGYELKSIVGITHDPAIFDSQSPLYDPLALPLAVMYITNNPYNSAPLLSDIRVRGGGLQEVEMIQPLIDDHPSAASRWDVYPPNGKAYPKGGYVVIQIPESVKGHFNQVEEIYNIIRSNLTAGIVFDLQDLDGNSWS